MGVYKKGDKECWYLRLWRERERERGREGESEMEE